MREHKNFWDRNAGRYDRFMRKDREVYEKMYELIRPVVKDKTVLELATGTGLIARHIIKAAAHIEARRMSDTDADCIYCGSVISADNRNRGGGDECMTKKERDRWSLSITGS